MKPVQFCPAGNGCGGNDWIVYRKGTTPSGKGVPGMNSSSMPDTGYIERGKDNSLSLNSPGHGAWRAM